MSIKFRCQHCQQLLGISRSRAGAVVDCPQCGRDLRVPELDGRTKRMPDARTAKNADSSLISALSELSALGQDHDVSAEPWPSSTGDVVAEEVNPQTDIIVEAVAASDPVDVNFAESTSPVVDAGPVAIYERDGGTSESLAELASLHSQESDQVVPDSLLDDMRSVSHPIGVSAASIVGGAFLLLFGLVVGWYLGRAKDGAEVTLPSFIQPIVARAGLDAPVAKGAVVEDEIDVSGRVQYQDDAGHLLPDSGAAVFLLPIKRIGSIKLSARSLKLPNDRPDRRATLAAITSYGGAFTTAGDDGRFSVTGRSGVELVVVAVSRHRERPEDLAVSSDVSAVLDVWFDSTSHLCGRLAAQLTAVDVKRPSVEVRFGIRQ